MVKLIDKILELEKEVKKLRKVEKSRQIAQNRARLRKSINDFLNETMEKIGKKIDYGLQNAKYFITDHEKLLKKSLIGLAAVALISGISVVSAPNINKWGQERKLHHSYNTKLDEIKHDITNGNYDGIEAKIRTLANDLEKNKPDVFTNNILNELKSLSYTKLVKIEARTERVYQAGHYEQVEVSSTRTMREPRSVVHMIVGTGFVTFADMLDGLTKTKISSGAADAVFTKKKEQVKETDYEKKWVVPTYKDVTTPAHYQRTEINPYSGTQRIIEDNISIK